jgi:ElaB/YqjD/DUF883 family membrane-anchored ribosome-binding protein
METTAQKTNGASDAARTAARDAGSAAENIGNAVKKGAEQVGRTTRTEASNLKADLDDLIAKIPHLSEADLAIAKQKLLDTYHEAKGSVGDLALQAKDRLVRGVDASGEYVKAKPLQSVGVAAVIGLLVGALLARR